MISGILMAFWGLVGIGISLALLFDVYERFKNGDYE